MRRHLVDAALVAAALVAAASPPQIGAAEEIRDEDVAATVEAAKERYEDVAATVEAAKERDEDVASTADAASTVGSIVWAAVVMLHPP